MNKWSLGRGKKGVGLIVSGLNHAMHKGDGGDDNGYDKNGKKINDNGGETIDYKYDEDGTIIDSYYTSTCDVVDNPGTYIKSGNTITVTFSDGSFTFSILKLTSTVLKVKNSDGYILEFIK